MTRTRLTQAELLEVRDLELGRSSWLQVGQDRVDGFATVTEDHQWVHVDPVRAASGPFGTTIAHGYLTLSLVPRLLGELVEVTDEVQSVNYGMQRLRFTAPVPVGSEVALTATINRAEPRAGGGVAYYVEVRVDVRDSERPALVGEVVYLSYAA